MMTRSRQKLLWTILLLFCHYVNTEEASPEVKEDLSQAEAKDGQLEIIKTIKKINDDGSYTIGYEADDGSFKIESRDVLGNVKGTYGYVDDDGEIKRVTYSSSNLTDLISDAPSVVQRIPKTDKAFSSTRRPGIVAYSQTTPSTPSSTSVIQAIPRRRTTTQTTSTTSTTTTTQKPPDRPSYGEYVRNSGEVLRSTTIRPPNIVYASSTPPRNIVFPQRHILRTTVTPQIEVQKSEGQILRPEIAAGQPTELPTFRRLGIKNALLESEPSVKPVTEEPEVRGNLLRRQLSQEKTTTFDPRQHVISLQQGLGDDTVDVYSASLTTGTPRPLFTTTIRPRILPTAQVVVEKPTVRLINTQTRTSANQQSSTEITQEAATTESTVSDANTPTSVPVYQIPPAQPENASPPLVAVRHPFHGGVVLVPFNQLRTLDHHPAAAQTQLFVPNTQYLREVTPTTAPIPEHHQSPAPVFIQRPPVLRSIPVHVDENGYVRPLPPQIVAPTPYPIPVPIPVTPSPPPPKFVHQEIESEVENIKPPVSTKDFQKLIELLIIRQGRLEQANALINTHRQRELFHQHRFRVVPHPTPVPVLIRRPQEVAANGPVTFIPEAQISRARPFVAVPQMQVVQPQPHEQPRYIVRPQTQGEETRDIYVQESPITYTPAPTVYTPTKRVARLLHSSPPKQQDVDDEYLPPQIREMLLLRMLQLAINPELPLNSENEEEDSMSSEQQVKKTGVRNVEVLGEETDEPKRLSRSKRFRGIVNGYYE